MSETRQCPECGAPFPASTPGGLCPVCLLQRGLQSQTAGFTTEPSLPAPTIILIELAKVTALYGGWLILWFAVMVDLAACILLWRLAPRWPFRLWSVLVPAILTAFLLAAALILALPMSKLAQIPPNQTASYRADRAGIAASPTSAAATQPAASAESPSFGPVIRRSLRGQDPKYHEFVMSLETGILGPAPPRLTVYDGWLSRNGIDLLIERKPVQALIGLDMATIEIPAEQWDALAPADVAKRFHEMHPGPGLSVLKPKSDGSAATFLFMTRAKRTGVLQFLGSSVGPQDLAFRYKLVQTAPAPQTRSASGPPISGASRLALGGLVLVVIAILIALILWLPRRLRRFAQPPAGSAGLPGGRPSNPHSAVRRMRQGADNGNAGSAKHFSPWPGRAINLVALLVAVLPLFVLGVDPGDPHHLDRFIACPLAGLTIAIGGHLFLLLVRALYRYVYGVSLGPIPAGQRWGHRWWVIAAVLGSLAYGGGWAIDRMLSDESQSSPLATEAASFRTPLSASPSAARTPAPLVILGEQPPVVVSTFPRSGAHEVAPGVVALRATFSKPMADGSWSWSTAWEGATPQFIGAPKYEADHRTCFVTAKLEPGRTYAF